MGLDTQQAQEVAALKQRLGNVRRQRGRLLSQLRAVENDLHLITETKHSFQDLLLFFLGVNLKRLRILNDSTVNWCMFLIQSLKMKTASWFNSLLKEEINGLVREIWASGLPPVSRGVLESYSTKGEMFQKRKQAYRKMEELKIVAKVWKSD